MNKEFWLATNDETGKTIVIVPLTSAKDAFSAMKVANKHFKTKLDNLHCVSGIKTRNKIESRDRLSGPVNCWMVWR